MDGKTGMITAYPAPDAVPKSGDYHVRVRQPGGEWIDVFVYKVRVDMHEVREASMAAFDIEGSAEVEVTCCRVPVRDVVIRPLSSNLQPEVQADTIRFRLDQPCKLSIEVNGERFHNLHLFADEMEAEVTDLLSGEGVYIEPGNYAIHEKIGNSQQADHRTRLFYFGPGLHQFEDGLFYIPSNSTVYIAGGAVIIGSLVCDRVENVRICGRGIIYLRDIEKTTYWRSVQIDYSRHITVEDIISIDPPHYSIHLGQSENVRIRNFKSFSTRGWCDGIDMMSCRNILIEDVFLRTSDDCIAVYGSRGAFKGDTANVRVKGAVLWADVAHPIMIGVHGDHEGEGDVIENLSFSDIDILEHHEPQDGYWGCMAINAGDKNTVRNVMFEDIRVEQFELGRLFDIRVFHNPKYNPHPGNRVENVAFYDVSFNGVCEHPSIIAGYDAKRIVTGVRFRNLRMNGRLITSAEEGNIICNEYQNNVSFE